MAEKIVSPGVFTNEIDASFLPAAIADIGAVVVGPTVKGPALTPIMVTSMAEYEQIFGTTFSSGSGVDEDDYSYLTSQTAQNYLRHSGQLTVVRILAGGFSGASTTVSSSADPGVLGGESTFGLGSVGFTQATSGTLGPTNNSMSISYKHPDSSSVARINFIFTGSHNQYNTSSGDIQNSYVRTGSSTIGFTEDVSLKIEEQLSLHFNDSSSFHSLPFNASFESADGAVATQTKTTFTASVAGNWDVGDVLFGKPITGSTVGGSTLSGSQLQFFTSSIKFSATGSSDTMNTAAMTGNQIGGATPHVGTRLNGSYPSQLSVTNVFKLHTLADGEILNSVNFDSGETYDVSNNMLPSGSKDNLRYEISTVNYKKGTFSVAIRRGNDTNNQKQILESYTNINLDPKTTNYIGKAIGDMKMTIRTDENGNPFLQQSGSNPNISKYVYVEVLETTPDYLDENGTVRIPAASASLPTFHSGSNSGSFGGSFSGGDDGTVTHPKLFFENISENSSQGLDPSSDSGDNGYNDYLKALNLLNNADEYDFNLLLMPGIIESMHGGVVSKAIDVCEDRGDCFVISDPVGHGSNVTAAVKRAEARNTSYGAMYWPWVKVPDNQLGKDVWVPPSVSVAGVYAFNDKVAHEWFAPAGLNRGTLDTAKRAERKLTQSNRDEMYDSNLNPIATFPGQGVTIFGQKTLQKKASALDRVNVRRLLIRVKKFIASSSRFLLFEQNTAATRRRFLDIANPFLEQIQSQSGLNAFRVVMDETNNTPDTIDRNYLVGQLFLQPTRTAEFIVLDFTIQRSGATFPE